MSDLISRKAVLAAIEPLLTALLDMTVTKSDASIITASVRALPSVGVTVRPLEWVHHGTVAEAWGASTPFGDYAIIDLGVNWTLDRFVACLKKDKIGNFRTIKSAKAAAQADYAARILAALDVQPAPAPSPDVAQSDLMQSVLGLRRIVEEIDGAMNHGTWRDDHGNRLKDTPEWVQFYNVLAALARKGGDA